MAIQRFEEIGSWQLAREFAVRIYRISNDGSFRRDFGLGDQIRRAAVSIMANIAEGFGRKGENDFARFLTIAQASALEVESHLYIALDLGYVGREEFDDLFGAVKRIEQMVGGLIRHLKVARGS